MSVKDSDHTAIDGVAKTIEWLAEERMRGGAAYQNLTSAIHAVTMDIQQILMDRMKEINETIR